VSETFDIRRLWLLIRADIVSDYRPTLIVMATLSGLMLLGSMFTVYQDRQNELYYLSWYAGALFIWGAIGASLSFTELHDKTKNEAYLLLPASALEKTLARLLDATVIFLAFVLLFLTIGSGLIEALNLAVFGRRNGFFNPLDPGVWQVVGHFIVVVSLYFLGAAWFRRLHFVKTALTLTALPIALAIFAAFVARIVFGGGAFDEMSIELPERSIYNYYLAHQGLFDALLALCKLVYFVVVPVFCWYVAWLRVKETQTSHGV
jgi:hypothetical protein